MKKHILNTIAALAVIAGLCVSVFAPWWIVWFVCLPVMFAGAVTLITKNTDWLWNS